MELLNHPFLAFLSYFVGGLVFIGVFVLLYIQITPFADFKLIRAGNAAAAYVVGGSILGFSLPLRRAIEQSMSVSDFLFWGLVGMLTQLVVFMIFSRVIPNVKSKVEANDHAIAILLAAISISVGMLNAAAMTS